MRIETTMTTCYECNDERQDDCDGSDCDCLTGSCPIAYMDVKTDDGTTVREPLPFVPSWTTVSSSLSALAQWHELLDNDDDYALGVKTVLDSLHSAAHADEPYDDCEACDYAVTFIDLATVHGFEKPRGAVGFAAWLVA